MEDGRVRQQEGGQNSHQHEKGRVPDKAPAGRAVQLVPPLALERRIGVELRGLRVLGGKDQHGIVRRACIVPAEILV